MEAEGGHKSVWIIGKQFSICCNPFWHPPSTVHVIKTNSFIILKYKIVIEYWLCFKSFTISPIECIPLAGHLQTLPSPLWEDRNHLGRFFLILIPVLIRFLIAPIIKYKIIVKAVLLPSSLWFWTRKCVLMLNVSYCAYPDWVCGGEMFPEGQRATCPVGCHSECELTGPLKSDCVVLSVLTQRRTTGNVKVTHRGQVVNGSLGWGWKCENAQVLLQGIIF